MKSVRQKIKFNSLLKGELALPVTEEVIWYVEGAVRFEFEYEICDLRNDTEKCVEYQ